MAKSDNGLSTGFTLSPNRSLILLAGLLIAVSLYDLFSAPLATTIWRQAQTALITENFVKEGFSLKGLYVGLKGDEKLMMVYEFPVYNFVVGVFFKLFNTDPFWGKLVSLVASGITLAVFYRLIRSYKNNTIAFFSALFFIVLPINVLMFTAFQPDALGVMFLMIGIYTLTRWRITYNIRLIFICSICLLLCGLCKFPILVPYIPLSILLYFYPNEKFRYPRPAELAVFGILFLIPFISWYMYRPQLIDPVLLGVESSMFFLGDFSRFLMPGYYLKLAMMFIVMVWCGTGAIYFFSGLKKLSILEAGLILGIPLYFIIIPTSAEQAYYLYPATPFIALFMAKGAVCVTSYLMRKHMQAVNYLLGISFIMFSLFGITYLLRKDEVMLPMAAAVQKVTKPQDLIFSINMHDRGVWVGGYNPSVAYFTKRNGWNIQNFNAFDLEGMISEINLRRDEGAKWLVITWYTPELEPWYTPYLPKQFSRLPLFDSKAVADKFKQHYKTEYTTNNFAVLKLR